MKNFNIALLGLGMFSLCYLQACKPKPKPAMQADDWHTGSAKFAVDESFRSIVEQEAYVFTALNTKAKPEFIYRDENDVVSLLLEDSVRMVMLSRDLDSDEVKILKTRNLTPETYRFAVDAVALIVNKMSNDTLMSVDQIKKMFTGNAKTTKIIVFDSPGSSLLTYFKTLCGVSDFKPKNIFALKSNKEVIQYVSTHPDAIGVTSFSWYDNPDSDYANAVKNVKIVAVKDEGNKKYADQYFEPSQTTLYLKQYPLSRGLFVVNCTGRFGLATGFTSFITGEKGQRIIMQTGILPDEIPGREVNIKRTFK
jgi:phosphate transport system substrate-binding protein